MTEKEMDELTDQIAERAKNSRFFWTQTIVEDFIDSLDYNLAKAVYALICANETDSYEDRIGAIEEAKAHLHHFLCRKNRMYHREKVLQELGEVMESIPLPVKPNPVQWMKGQISHLEQKLREATANDPFRGYALQGGETWTPDLLQAMMSQDQADQICAVPGCDDRKYTGAAKNPFNCCRYHRALIHENLKSRKKRREAALLAENLG